MASRSGLFDEFAAAFQFPEYFGGNWDALSECLCDRDLFPGANGIAVLIRDFGKVLLDEPPNQLEVLVDLLRDARAEYAETEAASGPLVFRVLLHADAETDYDADLARWSVSVG